MEEELEINKSSNNRFIEKSEGEDEDEDELEVKIEDENNYQTQNKNREIDEIEIEEQKRQREVKKEDKINFFFRNNKNSNTIINFLERRLHLSFITQNSTFRFIFKFLSNFFTKIFIYNHHKQLWFSYFYILDWVVSILIFAVIELVFGKSFGFIQPFEKSVPNNVHLSQIPSIGFPHRSSYVPTWLLIVIVIVVSESVFLFVQLFFKSFHDLHHANLGLLEALCIENSIVNIFKIFAGRRRPDYYSRIKIASTLEDANEARILLRDGKLSFPSGHSSFAFSFGVFLSCYLAGKTKFLSRDGHFGNILSLIIVLSPLIIAFGVAVSRTIDYHHNYSDILGGILIGSMIGFVSYHQNFHSIFSENSEEPKNRFLKLNQNNKNNKNVDEYNNEL